MNNKPLNLSPKGMEQMTLMQHGMDAHTALLLTNPHKDTISKQSVSIVKKKFKIYSLQNPGIVKLAHNVIKDVLAGQGIEIIGKSGTTETVAIPSATNRIAAAAMVYDRYEPVRSVQEATQQVIHPVNIGTFLNITVDKAVDSGSYQPQCSIMDAQVVDITDS